MAANTPPGPGVDASGQAVVDPTKNVLDLVEAAVRRQNDLSELRASYDERINTLRGAYEEKLQNKESQRIDAIRAVDVGNVQRAADVVAVQAETLRKQVADTATAFASSLGAALQPILKDIADLRQVQYETAGGKAQTTETREVGTTRHQGLQVMSGFLALLLTLALVGVAILALAKTNAPVNSVTTTHFICTAKAQSFGFC